MDAINQIAQLTGESSWQIKKLLGLSSGHDYSSFSLVDLKMAYQDAAEGSESEADIQEELIKRLQGEIASKSLERVREAYFLAKEFYLDSLAIKAFDRWEDISWQEVVAAEDYEKLKVACQKAPKYSRAYLLALEKKEIFLAKELNSAETLGDCARIFKKAFLGSQARIVAVKKMVEILELSKK